MTDIVDKQTRSQMMAGIKGKNTKPELVLRRALHARGLRFRLHAENVAGKPDLLFPKFKAAVFVNGCFWHRHGCRYTTTPSTRADFWEKKFSGNVARDLAVAENLAKAGWRIAIVWECAVRNPEGVTKTADQLYEWLKSAHEKIEIG
ncbi:very short patch repair endonuclease [Rhizobium tumorigenes]|uniref:very short patch repair endonuclease n=1 Tax=Rhizobium tumorigenes TaxID=2041385 RepID=UPI00241DA1B5|nr:very short patch repair endonuclease [Rhizobium tumorigenes]WFR99577.1 very short patch repair endonuclease [Rhizobium tumorigenes]